MTSVILLAGGRGARFDKVFVKQYCKLNSKEIALYSFDCFLSMEEVDEIVIVCEPHYQTLFNQSESNKKISFAEPGAQRQDSMHNGFKKLIYQDNLVCIHDAARPFINPKLVRKILENANKNQAATAAVPLKFTIKESDHENYVVNTPDRNLFWEIQTPQVIHYQVLKKGLDHLYKNNISVTDDVSIVELLGFPVKLVLSEDRNFKITTIYDYHLAHQLLSLAEEEKESCLVQL